MEKGVKTISDGKGLQFTQSGHVDSLKKIGSSLTIQSEPKGHFATLINHMRNITGNYVNILLQISEKNPRDAFAIVKYASTVEGMAIFTPRPVSKPKNDEMASNARAKVTECELSSFIHERSKASVSASWDKESKYGPDLMPQNPPIFDKA